MSDSLTFILTVLTAYRIWRHIAEDAFPPTRAVIERIEQVIEARFGPEWAVGIFCPWCSGFWVACGTVAAVWACRPLPLPGLWFAATSTLVGLLAQRDEA